VKRKRLSRWRASISFFLLIPIGLMVSFSPLPFDLHGWPDVACNVVGWTLFIIGGFFRWWGTLYVGGRKSEELVTEGAYSICRNPIYLGTFLILMATGVLAESLTFLVASILVAAVYLRITVPCEERRLMRKFPQAFAEYCLRTPRFFPRLSSFQSHELIQVNVKGLRAEFIRSLRWMWVPALVHVASHIRAQEWWPTPFQLP
jgi:protein-S-isoprenylcysteine O-methyltransferase Ste14